MKTAHQLARELLALPDLPIFHLDPSFADACDEETDYTVGVPSADIVDPRDGIPQDEADSMESDGVCMGKFVTISGDQLEECDRKDLANLRTALDQISKQEMGPNFSAEDFVFWARETAKAALG